MYEFRQASIIIATLNETYLLRRTVDILRSTCASDIGELIIVTSKKSTPENLRTVEEIVQSVTEFPVIVHRQVQPFVGMAFREAIPLARCSHIIMMVSDCEVDVRAAARLIEQAKRTPTQIITTSRWLRGGGFDGYNVIKLSFNRIFQQMMRTLYFTKLTDLTNSYQICPAYILKSFRFKETKKPFFMENSIVPLRLGVEIREIPCAFQRRNDGKDTDSFFQCFSYIKTALRVRLSDKETMLY